MSAVSAAPSVKSEFVDRMLRGIVEKMHVYEAENFDRDRFGWDGVDRSGLFDQTRSLMHLKMLMAQPQDLASAWQLMSDEASRDWFIALLLYRILGHAHVRLPSNRKEHWETRDLARQLPYRHSDFAGMFGPLRLYEVEFAGEKIALHCWWLNVAWTFFFRQYYLHRGGVNIAPEAGDHVIDAGACFGDTALAFAATVGDRGHVHSFEMSPENLGVAKRNLELNPRLSGRISLVEQALGSEAGARLYMHNDGPGACISALASDRPVEVTSIDAYVRRNRVRQIDFIKMDIEGAESGALLGASDTLRRFRPKLAISVYHAPDHIASIPLWLDGLALGYRFYLDHYTIHSEETVLYAVAAQ